jgi:hypothetical protein
MGLTYEMVVTSEDPTRPPMDRIEYSDTSKCVGHVLCFSNLSGGGRNNNVFLDWPLVAQPINSGLSTDII